MSIGENRIIVRNSGMRNDVLVRGMKVDIPCEIPTFMLCVWFRGLCLKSYEGSGHHLHLIVLKPHWLLQLCAFQNHEVEAKRLLILTTGRNRIDRSDRPSESSKGTMAEDLHATADGKYVTFHVEHPFWLVHGEGLVQSL